MKEALDAQDGLYTLVVKHADGTYEPRVIGSIVEYLFAPDDPEAVIEKLAAESTRIVSLTVTEGGYNLDHVTGEFDAATPTSARPRARRRPADDLRPDHRGAARRRERGLAPFTVMSCDNLQGNGDLHARGVHRLRAAARPRARRLGRARGRASRTRWSTGSRRRPPTPTAPRSRERFGIEDALARGLRAVHAVGARGRTSRPGARRYEDAGVQVVEDVEPYELMKLRLLNASHQALCYFAYLDGYRLVHEAAQDPLYRALPARLHGRGGDPTLAPVPGVDLDEYKATLIERFSNPEVRDTVARLCAESSRPHPEVAAARRPPQPRDRRRDPALGRGRRELGALRRGHRRAGRADRGRRPARATSSWRSRSASARTRRVHRRPRAVRRPRRRRALRRRLPGGAGLAARARRARDARALPERVAAVDDEHRAGHEARRVAGQVDERRPELLRQRVAPHRRVVDPAAA